MRRVLALTIAAVSFAACELGPKKQRIPVPNTPTPEKAGKVEQTKFADKVVTSNWTTVPLQNCTIFVGAHRGALAAIGPGETVTTMRSRFTPYVEAERFMAETTNRRMECDAPYGRVSVEFPYMGTFTAPAEALKRPR